ncbi:MAG TPA: hypothetical protein VFV87_09975, partial [Pirellulaceae bacterium]|nr:hypothetical protein [Pirellulaceae bacterium]
MSKAPPDAEPSQEDVQSDEIIGTALIASAAVLVIGGLVAAGVAWWLFQPAPPQVGVPKDLVLPTAR